ncbi:MAG: hypothetical protein WCL18_09130 [bacterium]
MKKKLIVRGVIIAIIILGFILGDIQLQIGTYSTQASTKTVRTQLTKLQNIS